MKVGDKVTVVRDVGDGFCGVRGTVLQLGNNEARVRFGWGTIKWYTDQELAPVDAVTLLGEVGVEPEHDPTEAKVRRW